MGKIKIFANINDATIHFDGSTVRNQPLGTVVALPHPTEATRMIIKSTVLKNNGEELIFFRRMHMVRVKNEDGIQLTNLGYSRDDVVAYLNVEFTTTLALDIARYRGIWNASTNTPDLTTLEPVNGDFLYVTTAGTYDTETYGINDTVRYHAGGDVWQKIEDQAAKVSDIEQSALAEYKIHVDPSFVGVGTGSTLKPFNSLQLAINNSSEGDTVLIKGDNVIAAELDLQHGLHFYGAEGACVRYTSYDATNGDVFSFEGTDNSQEFTFKNLEIKNAGGYGLLIKKALKVSVEDCTITNNGWNGTGLHTILDSATSGILGYDSDAADLQAFYAGANASNGGAIRIEAAPQVLVVGNTVSNNLRGIRIQDCGINGAGFISRNQSSQNIESGIYLAAGSLGGSQNVTVINNFSAYNSNNGLLVIGGMNNKFSQNEVNGNWNAGFMAWGASNVTLRDCGLYDNNRSALCGIGNTGDAKASIQIENAFSYLGTAIEFNPAFRFIAEILDTQVHYTGLGSNTEKIGLLVGQSVGLIAEDDKNIIKVDDVGFIGQDYAIDFSEVDLTNLKVAIGDNSYMSIGEKTVKQPLGGEYFELPFSNHITNVNYADFSVDNTGGITIKEGPTGAKLNPYKVNDLQAVAHGTEIRVMLKGSNKVQFEVPVAGCSIDGSFVNSVLNQALVQLNGLFTNTVGFASGGSRVADFVMSGTDLTISLEDGTSFTVDVTNLGVDENNFVSSGLINGSDLVLTMDDATTVTVDASGLAIDPGVTVTSGVVSGTDIVLTMSDASTITIDASALDTGTSINVSSGAVVGTNLVLTMSDSTEITIDATNMINGSTGFASGSDWYYMYGDRAGQNVNNTISDLNLGIASRAPFFFGTALARGTEFRWNFNNNKAFVLGVWDGATHNHSGTFNSRQQVNWSTGFWRDTSGFRDGTNVTLTNTTTTARYVPSFGAPLAMRFLNDGHMTLVDLSGGTEVEIAKTTNPLVDTSFQLQLGCDSQFVFPQFLVSDTDNIWDIVHDFAGTESGILNGILDHTILKSSISIEKGEKIMFMLDEVGVGDYFGTNYTNASTGVATAEEQLDNQFIYQTNEALVFTVGGASDWDANTNAAGYFYAASLDQYRDGGGSGTVQGMFSLRFNDDGKLTIFDEDAGVKVATAKMDPAIGSSVHLHYGVKGNRAYYSIPVISKQSLTGGTQPEDLFKPTVLDQAVSVEEGQVLNYTVVDSDNIVNQYVEVDAPSWMSMNQTTGVLSGVAPAFLGTAADTIVVACKAGNAVGGTVDFNVTITVVSYASTNTKSLEFGNSATYLQGNPANVTALQRTGNGSGASDAWSISMWVKPVTSGNYNQTLFYYGGDDLVNEGRIELMTFGQVHTMFKYGDQANGNISIFTVNALTLNAWNHIMVTYDGGLTGNTEADVVNYYGAFKVFINGVFNVTQFNNTLFGYSGDIAVDQYRIGRMGNIASNINYFDGRLDQVAVWNSDEKLNISSIYNSGVTQDLSLLASAPEHYYEVENSITSLTDQVGNADLTAYNFVASDLVTDAP